MRRAALALMIALTLSGPALAVNPDEQLADPALEARAVAISRELRCVVCQNQSIDDSDASLAADLRVLLRERLLAGDTDKQAKAYIVARYGDYVLLNPPFRLETLALWLGPLAALLAGGLTIAFYLRRRDDPAAGPATPLTVEEEARLKSLLGTEDAA
jgi:cytochrome c-type biogenesis protein CcmH